MTCKTAMVGATSLWFAKEAEDPELSMPEVSASPLSSPQKGKRRVATLYEESDSDSDDDVDVLRKRSLGGHAFASEGIAGELYAQRAALEAEGRAKRRWEAMAQESSTDGLAFVLGAPSQIDGCGVVSHAHGMDGLPRVVSRATDICHRFGCESCSAHSETYFWAPFP